MYIIGMDVGSVSINTVILDDAGKVVKELPYRRHFGLIHEEFVRTLQTIFKEISPDNVKCLALTGMHGELLSQMTGTHYEAETIAQVVGAVNIVPGVRSIISIGGQDAILFQIGYENGRWFLENFNINGPCASGTGSFIDQQAERLSYAMYGSSWEFSQEKLQKTLEDFIKLGLESDSPAPVACRCTVFTKSDMIHLQNKGEPLPNIIAGLHYGNAANFMSNIVGNRTIHPPVIFIGGMASNELQIRAFKKYFPDLIVPQYHTSIGAIGVGLIAIERGWKGCPDLEALERLLKQHQDGGYRYEFPRAEPLRLELTKFDDDNVISLSGSPRWKGFLGVDIGSTTTKYAFIDPSGKILHKCYVPTRGKPIEVTQHLLKTLLEASKGQCEILAIATTGSGRNVVGDFLDADLVVDEITAHAHGAVSVDPNVDTIFEIGGQDSKYIRVEKTHPIDFDMNKVCAAGTGSFLHELANKMKINIVGEFQEIALSSKSPIHLAERCTVFMESDVVGYAQKGARREDLIAGLCYAIVHNYLNRVVGKRFIGSRIMFLGGPSLNKGIVAAFERVLKKPIIVPKHREVMGAYGAALLVKEKFERGEVSSKDRDLRKLAEAKVSYKEVICRADPKCHNECKLKIYNFAGRKSVWGGDCGRYEVTHYDGPQAEDYIGKRNEIFFHSLADQGVQPGEVSPGMSGLPVVGIPLGLHFWEWALFWASIFRNLEFPVLLGRLTDQEISRAGVESVTAETCFPVKVFHGHVSWLKDRADILFLPNVINMPSFDEKETSFFCPLVEGSQYITRWAFNLPPNRIVSPTVYLKEGPTSVAESLWKELSRIKGARPDKDRLDLAVKRAWQTYQNFRSRLLDLGKSVLADADAGNPVWIISGRPYNLYDTRLNLQIGKHLAKRGIKAITFDFITLHNEDMSDFPRMYWGFGSRVLRAAKKIARTDHLYGVHLTNFSCGPDSFIEHFYRHVLSEKPALILEFDEHTAVAGILTRIEAYKNVVSNIENANRINGKLRRAAS
ncbi:MAG: CoA activase [Deltaproteobacteria bacterium]|nr:CoA activase [Deltaproteobacteria bacterium]